MWLDRKARGGPPDETRSDVARRILMAAMERREEKRTTAPKSEGDEPEPDHLRQRATVKDRADLKQRLVELGYGPRRGR